MRVVILEGAGGPAAASVTHSSVLRWHPDANVSIVSIGASRADPVPRVGRWRHVDLVAAVGPVWARWAALPGLLIELLDPVDGMPTLVLPDHAWVLGPLDGLIGVSAPLTVVARRGGGSDEATGGRSNDGLAIDGLVGEVLVVAPDAAPALERWAARVASALDDPELDPSTDPWRRLDVAFVEGDARVVADPAWRLGPWIGSDTPVDLASVALAHFPGFDPREPWWWPDGDAEGTFLSEVPQLRPLTHAYARALLDAGWDTRAREPTALDRVASMPGVRRQFHQEMLAAFAGDGPVPPNPLAAGEEEASLEWLTAAGPDSITGVSRVADAVWASRPDLHEVFPAVAGDDRERFVRWLWTHGLEEGSLPAALLPDPPNVVTVPNIRTAPNVGGAARPAGAAARTWPAPVFGVNLVGYHHAELGLGVAVRRMAAALDAAGIPWVAIDSDRTSSRRREVATGPGITVRNAAAEAPYAINLVLITPDQLGWFVNDAGPEFFADRYTIGLWYWETDVLPERTRAAFDQVDEVWAATEYLRAVFAAHTDRPVTRVPVPLAFDEPDRSDATRARLGLDDRFTFLFTFDFLSTMRRKNPLGLVDAYRRAFPHEDGTTRLVLKAINGERCRRDAEQLADAISDRDDIELWDRYLSSEDRLSLVALVDGFVSLHRSEGLGLTMAEAMWVGTPVIATAYSGNLDFMPSGAALMVDSLGCVPVGPGLIYPAEGRWADPDLDQAAAQMRRLVDDAGLRDQLAVAGRAALEEFSPNGVGGQVRARLERIWADH